MDNVLLLGSVMGLTLNEIRRSMEEILAFCDRALPLEGGGILMEGAASEVANRYVSLLTAAASPAATLLAAQ